MGGEGSMSAMNQSLANNRALLKKKRLKDNPYLKADTVKRKGKANYEELKSWRLNRSKNRARARWRVVGLTLITIAIAAALFWANLMAT